MTKKLDSEEKLTQAEIERRRKNFEEIKRICKLVESLENEKSGEQIVAEQQAKLLYQAANPSGHKIKRVNFNSNFTVAYLENFKNDIVAKVNLTENEIELA